MTIASQADRLAVLCRDAAVLAGDLQRLLEQSRLDSAGAYIEKMTAAERLMDVVPPIAPEVAK